MRTTSVMVFVLLALLGMLDRASGQAGSRLSASLLLARICVSEAGWDCFDTGDGLAIHEVLLRGAERHEMRYETFASTYSPRATGMAVSRTRPWVGGLREDGGAPYSWPRIVTRRRGDAVLIEPHPPWAHYRERWMAVLARAREVVAAHTLADTSWSPCESEVHDWGGAMDRARADRLGLIPVECGETANDFYARPSLVASEETEHASAE